MLTNSYTAASADRFQEDPEFSVIGRYTERTHSGGAGWDDVIRLPVKLILHRRSVRWFSMRHNTYLPNGKYHRRSSGQRDESVVPTQIALYIGERMS